MLPQAAYGSYAAVLSQIAWGSEDLHLRTWLRSLGPDAVMEEPESLRTQL
jgi:hypothetical protein